MDARNILDRLFPVKYHFYEMIDRQANINELAVETLARWLDSGSEADSDALLGHVKESDTARRLLEKSLIEAFATPFDRVDIYSLSSAMDKVIQYTKSTLLSMRAYGVKPNDTITRMVGKLKDGTAIFYRSAKDLEGNPSKSEEDFSKMRDTHIAIEQLYQDGMTIVFKSNDPMHALRQREVYHHIKDASANLEDAVDVLHRIVVRLT
ncbi:DUF47 domain-containing protein [Ethanoligenens harbinense]|uniref:DUF47 domain-containing protein n=1 Tax=Ethanoligenens harbinense (strain DSM 18485 / JCM 12961 / CGMCC 1.5033 / YUAN-3) TaxID=663278 RepID=E6U5E9_ETHHY|nr:DUF47 family protein [Ethanoligenens harbinense]ADU25616.1 hypothetical protein Ethha_0025 [Ethanoligenens harbinense YUAN-3]AVQ94793.1 DUF47 domain-containing protein [Ethanoligenens harbinense YUAN-3]AYF37484.1 DUF47 domain-containing protein [Ethanoligenens harbinense]AYF40203.1 DUF47 domain-containing protein [Ethanoligenens harbinense]QCN91039.1 DUF47 family protein [Ethanoligenens harbinense]